MKIRMVPDCMRDIGELKPPVGPVSIDAKTNDQYSTDKGDIMPPRGGIHNIHDPYQDEDDARSDSDNIWRFYIHT